VFNLLDRWSCPRERMSEGRTIKICWSSVWANNLVDNTLYQSRDIYYCIAIYQSTIYFLRTPAVNTDSIQCLGEEESNELRGENGGEFHCVAREKWYVCLAHDERRLDPQIHVHTATTCHSLSQSSFVFNRQTKQRKTVFLRRSVESIKVLSVGFLLLILFPVAKSSCIWLW
jgi:hypothetical protein